MDDGCPLRVDDRDRAAADQLKGVLVDADRGVLVDPYAEPVWIERDGAEQPGQPAALAEVHVDQHARQQAESRRDPHSCRGHLRAVAAEYHRPAQRCRARARPCDHEAVAEPVPEQVVDLRADQGLQPGLVTTAEKDAGGFAEHGRGILAIGVGAAADRQLLDMPDTELAEHFLVLSEYLPWLVSCGGDQHEASLIGAAKLNEALEYAGTTTPVFGSAVHYQGARISPVVHVQALVPDRGAAPGARSPRRYVPSIRSYSLPRMVGVCRLRRGWRTPERGRDSSS